MRGIKVGAWEGAAWQDTVRGTSMAQDRVQGGEGVWGCHEEPGRAQKPGAEVWDREETARHGPVMGHWPGRGHEPIGGCRSRRGDMIVGVDRSIWNRKARPKKITPLEIRCHLQKDVFFMYEIR